MLLLEEYQELIERDAKDISSFWKYVQMFLYLLGVISGYTCSVLFYIIWEDIFANNCPLWATTNLMLQEESESIDNTIDLYIYNLDWWNSITVHYKFPNTCYMYLNTSFLSCIFGIVWFTLFFMCGKGGHDVPIYEAPWRIVVPAICFNSIFTFMSISANYNLTQGYKEFGEDMKDTVIEINNTQTIMVDVSECEIIRDYMSIYTIHADNMCVIMSYLQVSSMIMVYSWVGGLVLLFWRVIIISDFKILNVKIYEVKTD